MLRTKEHIFRPKPWLPETSALDAHVPAVLALGSSPLVRGPIGVLLALALRMPALLRPVSLSLILSSSSSSVPSLRRADPQVWLGKHCQQPEGT